jgi:hypothetical protein
MPPSLSTALPPPEVATTAFLAAPGVCADTVVKKNAATSGLHRRKNLRIQQSIKQEVATSRRYDLQFKIERSGAIVSYVVKIKKMISNRSCKISFELLYCREKCCDYA